MILKMQSTMLELSAESFSATGCSSAVASVVIVVSVRVVVVVVEESAVVVVVVVAAAAVDEVVFRSGFSVTTSVVMVRLVSVRTGSCCS